MQLQYKLREWDEEWGPTRKFDTQSKEWISDTVPPEYSALKPVTSPFWKSPPDEILRIRSEEVSQEWAKVKRVILDTTFQRNRLGWTSDDSHSWRKFFQDPRAGFPDLSPWLISYYASLPASEPTIAEEAARSEDAFDQTDAPELFVAADKATAEAWKIAKRKRRIPDNPSTTELTAGDVVVIMPDETSRNNDILFGYTIPISFGKIESIDELSKSVNVSWLYASTIDGKFMPWPCGNASQPAGDTVSISKLQKQEGSDRFIKVSFNRHDKLTATSKLLIQHLVSDE